MATTYQTGITGNTANNIQIGAGVVYLNYGLANERVLGATKGGNTFALNREIRNIEVDGAIGKVKGLDVRDSVNPTLTVNLLEITLDNLKDTIAGAVVTSTKQEISVENETVGTGDGTTTIFTLDHSPVVANSQDIYVDGVLQTEDVDYSFDDATGTITFATAPTSGAIITADYTYTSGDAGTHDTIQGGEITDTAYIDNVAIVVTQKGSQYGNIYMVKNALPQINEIPFEDKGDTVIQVTFEGRVDPTNPNVEPWEIRKAR